MVAILLLLSVAIILLIRVIFVELCQQHLPTYFIRDADELLGPTCIRHLELETKQVKTTENWLFQTIGTAQKTPTDIVLTAGASCPDVLLDEVLQKIIGWFPETRSVAEVLEPFL